MVSSVFAFLFFMSKSASRNNVFTLRIILFFISLSAESILI